MTTQNTSDKKSLATGPAAAAMIASGIGALFIGMMTTGAEVSEGLHNFLDWYNPAGPLTGKVGIGILAWLISWALLNTMWKDKDYDINKAFTITISLLGVALLLTFPLVFTAFAK